MFKKLIFVVTLLLGTSVMAGTPKVKMIVGTPNGGEAFIIGQTQPVTLIKTRYKLIDVEISRDNGQTYVHAGYINNRIKDRYKRNRLEWLVEGPPSTTCAFRFSAMTRKGRVYLQSGTFSVLGKEVVSGGPVGPVGPQGFNGAQGIVGDDGPVGPIGPKGDKGDQGLAGRVGLDGIPGEKGDKGDIGSSGPPGQVGLPGLDGTDGDDGLTGEKGAQGEAGIPGTKGDTGDIGPAGAQGPQGIKGDTGAKGDTGLTGADGVAGPAGVKGDKGDSGEVGPQGPEGPQGIPGAQGPPGTNGINGIANAYSGEVAIPGGARILTVRITHPAITPSSRFSVAIVDPGRNHPDLAHTFDNPASGYVDVYLTDKNAAFTGVERIFWLLLNP